MPINKRPKETREDFISRCMSAEHGKFPDEKQRYAVCIGYWTDSADDGIMSRNVTDGNMIRLCDRAKIGDIKTTEDGYVITHARVARTGVQTYLADELGIEGGGIVRVNRPEGSVFASDSLQTLSHAPITIDHPRELVTADNHSSLAKGEVGEQVMRDGDWIVIPLILKDAEAIKLAKSSHAEISMGYTAELVRAEDGAEYDYEMTNFRHNHVALVQRARAGSKARFGDNAANWGAMPVTVTDKKEPEMVDLVKVKVGKQAVQVAATDADFVTTLVADHATEIVAKDKEIGRLTAELADAQSKIVSDEDFAARVAAKVEADKKREAVKARIGDKADAMSDAAIDGAFVALDAAADDTARKVIADKKPVQAGTWDKALAKLETYKERK